MLCPGPDRYSALMIQSRTSDMQQTHAHAMRCGVHLGSEIWRQLLLLKMPMITVYEVHEDWSGWIVTSMPTL